MRSNNTKKTRVKYQRPQPRFMNMCRDLSYNKFITIALSGKHSGKTTYGKTLIINYALHYGMVSVFLKRKDIEINTFFIDTFIDAEIQARFPSHEFTAKKTKAGATLFVDGKPYCYCFAISTMNNYGGNTLSQPVAWFWLDECMPNFMIGQKYAANEAFALWNFYKSITRNRDPRHDNTARILMTGNPVSMTSPYFDFWGITVSKGERSTGNNVRSTDEITPFTKYGWIVHYDPRNYDRGAQITGGNGEEYLKYLTEGKPLITDARIEKRDDVTTIMILAYRNKQYTISQTSDAFLYVSPWRGESGDVIGSHQTNTGAFFIDITHLYRTKQWLVLGVLIRSNRLIFESQDLIGVREELFRLVSY